MYIRRHHFSAADACSHTHTHTYVHTYRSSQTSRRSWRILQIISTKTWSWSSSIRWVLHLHLSLGALHIWHTPCLYPSCRLFRYVSIAHKFACMRTRTRMRTCTQCCSARACCRVCTCTRVLQCVAVCCSVLQCGAVWCSVLSMVRLSSGLLALCQTFQLFSAHVLVCIFTLYRTFAHYRTRNHCLCLLVPPAHSQTYCIFRCSRAYMPK